MKRVDRHEQKWKKGHGHVSNPLMTEHRGVATNRFFQRRQDEGRPTMDAFARRAEMSGVGEHMGMSDDDEGTSEDEEYMSEDEEDLSEDEEDLDNEEESFGTLSTNSKFFQTFYVSSEHQTRMLAFQSAAQEYIKEQNMPESYTPFYCALVISLEGMQKNADVAADVSLMMRISKQIPLDILKLKFDDLANALDKCLVKTLHICNTKHADFRNVPVLTDLMGCLSVLLRAQHKDQWTSQYTMSLFQKIIALTTHENPKIGESAQYNTSAIIKGSVFIASEESAHPIHPASSSAAEFCIAQLGSASETKLTNTISHVLALLRQIIITFPKKELEVVCKTIISVMHWGSSQLNTYCLQTLYVLFASEPPASLLPAETNLSLINALSSGPAEASSHGVNKKAGIVPSMNDTQFCVAWITVQTVAHINLFKLNVDMGINQMAQWFQRLISYWRSRKDGVHFKVYQSMGALLEECVASMDQTTMKTYSTPLLNMLKTVESALSLQYYQARGHVFTTLAKFFQVLGPHFGEEMLVCLKRLTDLMDTEKLPGREELERTIGSAIQGLGPKAVVSVVPFQITGNIKEDEKYFWILPVMKRHVKETQLAFYGEFFVPLAEKCTDLISSMKVGNESERLIVEAYQTIEREIWSLLPCFCEKATDIQETMTNEKFVGILCDSIKFKDDTRRYFILALRTIIEDNLENPGQLVICGEDYIPALISVYLCTPKSKEKEGGEGPFVGHRRRLEAYAAMKIYLKIMPQPKINELVSPIIIKYSDEKNFAKIQPLLDIARAFLPYLDSSLLQKLYNEVIPLLEQAKEEKEQRPVYRVLEEFLALENTEVTNFVADNIDNLADIFLKSLSTAVSYTKAPRLRCVQHILRRLKTEMEDDKKNVFVNQVVVESIMCCSWKNSKEIRKTAYQLLQELRATVQQFSNSTFDDIMLRGLKLLMAGLAEAPAHALNTVFAITSLLDLFKGIMKGSLLEFLMQNMCTHLVGQAREIVGASLVFLRRAVIVLPKSIMADYLNTLVQAICGMTPAYSKEYKKKTQDIFVRLMRKYGEDSVIGCVLQENKIYLNLLRNLSKTLPPRRKPEMKKGGPDAEDEDDDDYDYVEDGIDKALTASLDEILKSGDAGFENEDKDEAGNKNKRGKRKMHKATTEGSEDDDICDLDDSIGQSLESERPTKRLRGNDDDSELKVDSTGTSDITEEKGKEALNKKLEHMDDIDEMLAMKTVIQEGRMKKRKRTPIHASMELPFDLPSDQASIFAPFAQASNPPTLLSQETISRLKLKGRRPMTKRMQRRNALFAGQFDRWTQGGGMKRNRRWKKKKGKGRRQNRKKKN